MEFQYTGSFKIKTNEIWDKMVDNNIKKKIGKEVVLMKFKRDYTLENRVKK